MCMFRTMSPRPYRDRVRTNVFLGRVQRERLIELSSATGVPWSEYVREGVEMVLKKYSRQVRKKA